jgi:hypothetical protein
LISVLEKFNEFAGGKFNIEDNDIEGAYTKRIGDTAERMEQLSIAKRFVSTGPFQPTYIPL